MIIFGKRNFFRKLENLFQVSGVSFHMTGPTHTYAKQTILKKAEALFLRLGVKSVSMDDVASELGISKKTLYQFFESKEELLLQAIREHQCEESEAVSSICRDSQDALQEILHIARLVILQMQQISPAAIFDLKKYYPEAWKEVVDLHKGHIYGVLRENLDKGIRQGLYREEINPDIIARLYLSGISSFSDENLFPSVEFPRDRLFREFIFYHLRGIVSARGLEKLLEFDSA